MSGAVPPLSMRIHDVVLTSAQGQLYLYLYLGSTQPPIQWVPGALSLGIKRPRREADHSSPSSAEVKA
jgi:hypothetical protein